MPPPIGIDHRMTGRFADYRAYAVFAFVSLVTSNASATASEFGAYVGAGCDGAKRVAIFEQFVGRKLERTVDALNQSTWPELESSIDWIIGCWDKTDLKLTLSVPMLTRDASATLAEGAGGKYDATFLSIANALIAHNRPDATVRIGWEFNGHWQPWSAAKDPASFIAYFRRIVGIMRQADGQRFQFEWTPNHGRHEIDPPDAYPGDDVVDIIGMDVYDEYWSPLEMNASIRWTSYVYQPYGLNWHRDFAKRHGKSMAYSEWGTGTNAHGSGGGDNPVFIRGMAEWFAAANPLYQSYWDNPSPEFNTMLSGGQFPLSAAEYVRRFNADRTGSLPAR